MPKVRLDKPVAPIRVHEVRDGALMKVVFVTYESPGAEVCTPFEMPQAPAVGDTVHLSLTGDEGDSRAWRVTHVSWALTDDQVEISLR
jgi:hypothetical protein